MNDDETSLAGRVALVTGAGRRDRTSHGGDAGGGGVPCGLLLARSAEELIETAAACEEFGVEALVLVADVTDPAELTRAFERVHEEFRRLDILIANAGMTDMAPAFAADPEVWDQVIEVNLRSTMRAARLSLPYLLNSSRPAIVFVASTASKMAFAEQAAYVASKHGVLGRSAGQPLRRCSGSARHQGVFGVSRIGGDAVDGGVRGGRPREDAVPGGCRRCHHVRVEDAVACVPD